MVQLKYRIVSHVIQFQSAKTVSYTCCMSGPVLSTGNVTVNMVPKPHFRENLCKDSNLFYFEILKTLLSDSETGFWVCPTNITK